MSNPPTPEQQAAIEGAQSGRTIKITAYAGTGKTSTLIHIGHSIPHRRFTYLAFNKAIAQDAQKKFSQNVRCHTFHSMAFNNVSREITKNLTGIRWMPDSMAQFFGLKDISVPMEKLKHQHALLSKSEQAYILISAVNMFCRSPDSQMLLGHVVKAVPEWVENHAAIQVAKLLYPHCKDFWEKCTSKDYDYKISHDLYLKLWAMQDPVIPGDYLMMDEAQDADPLMLNILSKQKVPIIFVGDRNQAIYGWRGSLNAMKSINAPEYRLTKSFRFGQAVADKANQILSTLLNEHVPLIGNEAIDSTIGPISQPQAFLVRTNVGAFSLVLDLLNEGRKPRVEMDTASLITDIEDAIKLERNLPLNKSSIFFGFNSWDQVERFVKDTPGSDLKAIVSLISRNSPQTLLSVLSNLSQKDGDCVVSTAHKSKGLEFDSVYLHGDYNWKPDASKLNQPICSESEAMLIYVATTRAKYQLDTGGMGSFFEELTLLKQKNEKFRRKLR